MQQGNLNKKSDVKSSASTADALNEIVISWELAGKGKGQFKLGSDPKALAQITDLILLERIDELQKVPKDNDYFSAIKIQPYIKDRIKALKSESNRGQSSHE